MASERESRAQAQVNEIVAEIGPREAGRVLQTMSLLSQAERAVRDCREAVANGAPAGTFGFTADVEDEKAQDLADFIASEWDRTFGDDRNAE